MEQLEDHKERAIKYYLGRMSTDEEAEYEEFYFSDDEAFKYLQEAREDLIDNYLQGNMSSEDREAFQTTFLASPAHLQELIYANSLMQVAKKIYGDQHWYEAQTKRPLDSRTIPGYLFASRKRALATAAAVLVIVLGLLLLRIALRSLQATPPPQMVNANGNANINDSQIIQSPSENSNRKLANQNAGPDSPHNPQPELPPMSVNTRVATVYLEDISRGSPLAAVLVLYPTTKSVQLVMALPEFSHKSYRATLFENGGRKTSRKGLTPQTINGVKAIIMNCPTRLFDRPSYNVELDGITSDNRFVPVSRFPLKVERKQLNH